MSAFFHLITALHGLHLVGGLTVWGRTTARALSGDQAAAAQSVELCAVYWHFLLLVWLAMFGLLLVH
jgi:cytochrome c oxidase subunit 3